MMIRSDGTGGPPRSSDQATRGASASPPFTAEAPESAERRRVLEQSWKPLGVFLDPPFLSACPREFQIGAWASMQSEVLESRAVLDQRVREARDRFEGATVSRPPFWTGFRLVPQSIEFWTRDPNRLHDRILYERRGASWTRSLLFP